MEVIHEMKHYPASYIATGKIL